MKTAMQELICFLEPELKMGDFLQLPAYEKTKSLLEKEKQQIIDAAKHGANFNESPFANAEQYYNGTFNS